LRHGASLADSFGPKVNLAQVGGGLSSSTSEKLSQPQCLACHANAVDALGALQARLGAKVMRKAHACRTRQGMPKVVQGT